MQKFITTLALLAAFPFTFSGAANGQNCPIVESQKEAYARAAAVFVGRVKHKGGIFAMTQMAHVTACLVTYQVTFAVEKSYFQASDPEYTISSDYPLDEFSEHETYLVYVYEQDGMASTVYDYRETKNGLINPSSCSRTKPLSNAEGDLPFLDDLTNRSAGVTIHGSVTRKAKPFSGARLTVEGEGRMYEALTDSDGKYQIAGLKAGKYRVRLKLPWKLRSNRANRRVTVSDRGSISENFVVKPRFGW